MYGYRAGSVLMMATRTGRTLPADGSDMIRLKWASNLQSRLRTVGFTNKQAQA